MSTTAIASPVCRFLSLPCVWTYIALVTLVVCPAVALAQDLSGRPAKIELSAKPLTGNEQGVKVHVELRDPVNHIAVAPKDVQIEIEGRTDKGAAEKSTVLIKQGESSVTTELPIKTAGLVEVTAKNPQLAEGGTLVELRTSPRERRAEPPPAPPPPPPMAGLSAPVETGSAGPSHARELPRVRAAAALRRENFATPTPVAAAPMATPAATPVAPAEGPVAPNWSP